MNTASPDYVIKYYYGTQPVSIQEGWNDSTLYSPFEDKETHTSSLDP